MMFVIAYQLIASLLVLPSSTTVVVAFTSANVIRFNNNNYGGVCINPQHYDLLRVANAVDDFDSFAASLEDDDDDDNDSSGTTATAQQTVPKTSTTATTDYSSSTTTTNTFATDTKRTWQDDLDELLDPATPIARRQVLLSGLVTANADIRASVERAFADRKIDPLLTPTGKKLQDGTRAVARQLTNDILPNLQASSSSSTTSASSSSQNRGDGLFPTPPFPLPTPPLPDADSLQKVTGRVFNALQNQVAKNLETLQNDLANPSRIPQRLNEQTDTIMKEASNIFSETPVGLKEPPYTIIKQTPSYEIRQYDGYKVASTNMAPADEIFSMDNLGQSGAAFNSLAAYLFGANRGNQVMDMTTPVTTTMSGEMRFYLDSDYIPDPLEQDEGKSVYETGSILIQEIPPALLAVRKFPGFSTEGEIGRQKKSLLAALQLDNVALDVAHGQVPGHVVFQYNPPYTIPVLRRNEIAVPVLDPADTTTTTTTGKSVDDMTTTSTATTTESYTAMEEKEDINGDWEDTSPSD